MSGAVAVFSGGLVDAMNPPDVLSRMDAYIGWARSTFQLDWPHSTAHIHHSQWRQTLALLQQDKPTPLILVGHSNGGAAVMNVARELGYPVDFLCTCDSVPTGDDVGDIYQLPSSVMITLNTYTMPSSIFWLIPFPIGTAVQPLNRVVNVGFHHQLPGAIAHRDAFMDIVGGGLGPVAPYPHILQEVTTAVLAGQDIAPHLSLQTLSNGERMTIQENNRGAVTVYTPLL